jgi:type I restriction enzyme S subunit
MALTILSENFDLMMDAPNSVEKIRTLILHIAFQGKLVTQDPNDESAKILLKKIKAEKALLIKDGRIKKEKPLAPINENENISYIPKGWVQTKLGEVLTVIRGASPRPKGDPRYFANERTQYHWVKISDIRKYSKNRVLMDTDEYLTEQGMKKSVYLPKGTLILTNSATIGVPVFLGINGCIHDGYLAFPFFPDRYLDMQFIYYLFLNIQTFVYQQARGLAQLNLNIGIVRNLVVPIPPF